MKDTNNAVCITCITCITEKWILYRYLYLPAYYWTIKKLQKNTRKWVTRNVCFLAVKFIWSDSSHLLHHAYSTNVNFFIYVHRKNGSRLKAPGKKPPAKSPRTKARGQKPPDKSHRTINPPVKKPPRTKALRNKNPQYKQPPKIIGPCYKLIVSVPAATTYYRGKS